MSLPSTLTAFVVCTSVSTSALAGGLSHSAAPSVSYVQEASDIAAPPALANTSTYLTNTETASFPGTLEDFRAFVMQNPITDFVVATDAIPEIENITYLSGNWPDVGAVRRVDLAGGHHVHERVLANTPTRFAYQIWDITAPSGRVVDHIMGEFQYSEADGQVNVVWNYNIKPSIFLARPAIRRYLANDFAPFMQAGLTGLVEAYQQ